MASQVQGDIVMLLLFGAGWYSMLFLLTGPPKILACSYRLTVLSLCFQKQQILGQDAEAPVQSLAPSTVLCIALYISIDPSVIQIRLTVALCLTLC